MKKVVLAFVLLTGLMGLAGCADNTQASSDSGGSSSENSSVSSEPQSQSDSDSEFDDSDSDISSDNSDSESSNNGSSGLDEVSDGSSEDSQPSEGGVHLSVCKVPAWGVDDKTAEQNIFVIASEYETYRVRQTVEFENDAVKEITAEVYVISEEFDMRAFTEKWGFEPVWNGSYYEGKAAVPEEYAGMSVEEVKLSVAEPILKKYGSATYDGFPEIVMVDPETMPDPAIEF